jgi:hypothetical protein
MGLGEGFREGAGAVGPWPLPEKKSSMRKIAFHRLLTAMGLLVMVLPAAGFILKSLAPATEN